MTRDEELTVAVQIIEELYRNALYTSSIETINTAKAFLLKHQDRRGAIKTSTPAVDGPPEADVSTEGDDQMLDWFNIQPGDILTHKQSGDGYIVTDKMSNGQQVVLVRTLLASNPREWDLYHDPTDMDPRCPWDLRLDAICPTHGAPLRACPVPWVKRG